MIQIEMPKRGLAVLGLALAGTEAGHLLAYQLRFGAGAFRVQSTGVHAYFPLVVKTTLGAVALALIVGLLMAGAARLLAGGRGPRRAGGSFIGLLATLFTMQLALYMGQEVAEAIAGGLPPDSASNLLLWGMVGQLPVALAGTAALRWFWTRVEAVASELSSSARVYLPAPVPATLAVVVVRDHDRALVPAQAVRSSFVKRGPPISSSTRAF
jgi:hypothetical protein